MKKIISLMMGATFLLSANVMAEFDLTKIYVGAGGAYNSPDSSVLDSAIGFQAFGGYDMADIASISDEVGFAVEVGYASSGDFEWENCSFCEFSSSGLWSTAVFDYAINDEIKAVARIGYDFADADGFMFGGGAQYSLNEQMAIRAEFVIREFHKGIQADFIYYLGE